MDTWYRRGNLIPLARRRKNSREYVATFFEDLEGGEERPPWVKLTRIEEITEQMLREQALNDREFNRLCGYRFAKLS